MRGWWLVSYVVLWALVASMFVVLLVVLRQLGLLYLRGGGAPRLEEGPPVGAIIPPFEERQDGTGDRVAFPSEDAALSLVLFVSPDCRICEDAVRGLADVGRDFDVMMLVVSEGEPDENRPLRELVDGHAGFATSSTRQRILRVQTHPYGVVTDRNGVVLDKGVVNGPRDLEVLIQQADRASRAEAAPITEGGG
ncbi:MAG TPA: hypothetical protein VJN50_09590 [Actinomycetota bacterium]|nr:hypothetical protein [Actinomycetota bacterium]